MLNKNERMEQLKANGINVGKYFTVDLDNGTKIHLIIDENGNPVRVDNQENDPILNQIIEDGYVKNTKLFRRFVMAQMFYALNYVSYSGREMGYNDYIKTRYDYKYQFKMMLEEVRVLSKLEARDKETFEERAHFFDRAAIAAVLEDYVKELKKYVDKLPTKKCKGVPYKKVKGVNIFVADFDKKLYFPVKNYATQVRCAKDYNKIYYVLRDFMKNMVKLPYNTKKSKAWLDAYKGEGAFYTLKNLVMFHDCGIVTEPYNVVVRGTDAVAYLNKKNDEYKGEGWRMFALMKKVIKDNGINTKTHIAEVCKNK
jgi:hypothetical protein